ncbi:hypothetical protein J4E89_006103 [Alternaria sp. Ai002NY15]|nr:hypothetical protein J4E89_006103 [Alternaria sp. Ai002NY15]
MSRPSQSSGTRGDFEAFELTPELTTTIAASKTRPDDDTTVVSAYSQSVIDPVSKVNENESRLRRERDAALCTVGEQKRKLNNLYTKIGQLWEENDALKENTTTSKGQEKSTEELCGTCGVKDAEIAQLHEKLDSAGESSEENKDIGSRTQECNLALSMKTNELFTTAVEAKTDPDEDAAQAGLRIAYFKAEEELRTKDLAHAAEIAKIKEEHGIVATRLHEEVRDARIATNEEHAEKLCTQEQLFNITQELSDTKKQLFDSEEQYRILYDIIPKPGGGRMAKLPLPAIPQSSHNGEVESSSPSVPRAFSLVPTDHSHRGHSQDKEASSIPSHISNGSKSSIDQHTFERSLDATRAPTFSAPSKRAFDQVDDTASPARDKHETPALISKRGPGRPRKATSTFVVNKPSHQLDQDQSSTQRPKKRRRIGFRPYKPKLSPADDIPWLFCVASEGEGIRYHTLDELSPDAQAIVTERFQYWFSASSNAQYNLSDISHHNDYAKMVKEGNRLANIKTDCGAQGKESDRSAESVRAQFRGALRPLDPTEPNKPITELADRAEKLRAKIESGDYVSVDERYPEAAINIPGDDKSDAGL